MAGDAQGTAFRGLCKAIEAKLGAAKKPVPVQASQDVQAGRDKSPEVSICVLPFANMSGDPEQEYYSDGITEDIITDLGKVSALSVVSRNMAFSFKGAKGGAREIGRLTKASYVLAGSVRKAGERVRITAQLVNADNDAQIWGDRYDRNLNDIFALQDEISKAIVAALKLTLLPEEKRALEQRATTNVKAYKLYLMARQFSVMGNERHQELIIRLCERAVDLDKSYAAPWTTMAITQHDMYQRGALTEDGLKAAYQAIKLDPTLPDAHAALGAAHNAQGNYELGLRACQEALQLDPESYEGNRIAGRCSMALHRFEEAIGYFEAAAAAVPTEFAAASFVPQCYEAKGDREGAQAAARRALARIEKVIAVEPDHGRALGYGAGLLACLGEVERTKEWVERGTLLEPDNFNLQYNLVCALSVLRETQAALDMLSGIIERASRGWVTWLDTDTDLDPLRDDPRFIDMVRRAKARFSTEKGEAVA